MAEFFQEFNPVERSGIFQIGHDGRKNGCGAILFKSEELAEGAVNALNRHYIGSRYVELDTMSYAEYSNFKRVGAGNANNAENIVKLSNLINPDNQERALLMRGLPYRIQAADIHQFFGECNIQHIFIEEYFGKRTGSAAVIFENQQMTEMAKEKYHRNEI